MEQKISSLKAWLASADVLMDSSSKAWLRDQMEKFRDQTAAQVFRVDETDLQAGCRDRSSPLVELFAGQVHEVTREVSLNTEPSGHYSVVSRG